LGPRQWDALALWHFREFNELPHVFERRISLSYEHAGRYVRRFHSPATSVGARGVAFVSGSVVAVLVALTVAVDDAFLFHVAVGHHNLLW
jgi:autophagy-related protein 9